MNNQRNLEAVLRNDFLSFIQKSFLTVCPAQDFHFNWHLESIAWHLQQCLEGKIRRLIITLPPRSMKSISASVAFPAFVLGHHPSKRIICASYSSELADKHARDCRSIMQSDWYRRLFPSTRLSANRRAGHDFTTTQRGFRFATSVQGTLTGRGGNLIIIDDPMKSDEAMSAVRRKAVIEWFDNTIHTRLDDKKNDVIIIIMQRLHMDDLIGHILRKDDSWAHLNLPAIAVIDEKIPVGPDHFYHRRCGELLHGEREPMDILEGLRTSMGSYHFSAQYQQNPVPQDGEIFKWGWFKNCEQMPVQAPYGDADRIVQSWDTASKAGELNDYSVCTTWMVRNKKEYYLLDVFREKLNYPDLRSAVHGQSKKYRDVDILLEDSSSGIALLQDIRATRIHTMKRILGIKPVGDKIMRASSVSAVIEEGRVFLPRQAPWLEAFRSELLQFPNGRHDDQVDSMTQFLKWEKERDSRRMWIGTSTGLY